MALSITDRHRDFARRFLHPDSDTQGDFHGSMRAAKFKRSLDPTSRAVAKVLADTHNELVLEGVDPNALHDYATDGPQREAPPSDDVDLQQLEELLATDGLAWDQMAGPAKRVLAKIATGKIQATTQQVASIKEILTRAEGRAGATVDTPDDDDNVVRVVLLPTIDHGQGPIIDLGEVGDVDAGDHVPGLSLRQAMESTNR